MAVFLKFGLKFFDVQAGSRKNKNAHHHSFGSKKIAIVKEQKHKETVFPDRKLNEPNLRPTTPGSMHKDLQTRTNIVINLLYKVNVDSQVFCFNSMLARWGLFTLGTLFTSHPTQGGWYRQEDDE